MRRFGVLVGDNRPDGTCPSSFRRGQAGAPSLGGRPAPFGSKQAGAGDAVRRVPGWRKISGRRGSCPRGRSSPGLRPGARSASTLVKHPGVEQDSSFKTGLGVGASGLPGGGSCGARGCQACPARARRQVGAIPLRRTPDTWRPPRRLLADATTQRSSPPLIEDVSV